MTPRTDAPSTFAVVARSMMAEAVAAKVAGEFQAAGIDLLVFKGPVVAQWLYGGDQLRDLGDVDVIVPRSQLHDAEHVLARMRFVSKYEDESPNFAESHGDVWVHERWLPIDLHRRLWGMGVNESRVWDVISRDAEVALLADAPVPVPRKAVQLVLLALHAAHHGNTARKPQIDLERAISAAPRELWAEAAATAEELHAVPPFTTGLHILPEGAELAEELGLPKPDEVEWLAERYETYLPPTAEGFLRLAEARSWQAKRQLLRREVLPSPTFMRLRSTRAGLAQRGRAGLVAAYVLRWYDLIRSSRAGYRHARSVRQNS